MGHDTGRGPEATLASDMGLVEQAAFLTSILDSGTHWLRRPIVPNQLGMGVDLFGGGA